MTGFELRQSFDEIMDFFRLSKPLASPRTTGDVILEDVDIHHVHFIGMKGT